jgi:hypothetical protein
VLTINRLVTVNAPVQPVFDYLADFTTTNEWDPRASDARRCHGDGGPGTVYTCAVSFLGRRTTMTYCVTVLEAPRRIEWSGRSRSVWTHDSIRLAHLPNGTTTVDYTAQIAYPGLPASTEFLLRPSFERLCDDSRNGLQATLAQLAATPNGFVRRSGGAGAA